MVSQLSSCLPVPVSEGSVALRGVRFPFTSYIPFASFLGLPRHTVDVILPFPRHSWPCPVISVSVSSFLAVSCGSRVGLVILGHGGLFLRLPRHSRVGGNLAVCVCRGFVSLPRKRQRNPS